MQDDMTIHELALLVKKGFDVVDGRFDKLEVTVASLEVEMRNLKTTMITQYVSKDYFDQKLETFELKLVGPLRQEDKKVNTLVTMLTQEKALSEKNALALSKIDVFRSASKS